MRSVVGVLGRAIPNWKPVVVAYPINVMLVWASVYCVEEGLPSLLRRQVTAPLARRGLLVRMEATSAVKVEGKACMFFGFFSLVIFCDFLRDLLFSIEDLGERMAED